MFSFIPIRKWKVYRLGQELPIELLIIDLLTSLQHQAVCCREVLRNNETSGGLNHDCRIVKLNILRKAFDHRSLFGIWYISRDILLNRELLCFLGCAEQLVLAEVLVDLKIKKREIAQVVTTERRAVIRSVRVFRVKLETVRAAFELLEPGRWGYWQLSVAPSVKHSLLNINIILQINKSHSCNFLHILRSRINRNGLVVNSFRFDWEHGRDEWVDVDVVA